MDFCVHDADSQRMKWCLLRALLGFVGASNLAGVPLIFLFYVPMRHLDSYHAGEWASSLFFATMKTQLEECILNRRSRFDLTACSYLACWHCLLICTTADVSSLPSSVSCDIHHRFIARVSSAELDGRNISTSLVPFLLHPTIFVLSRVKDTLRFLVLNPHPTQIDIQINRIQALCSL